ncbi:MAG TPA: pentapeptide repeat-containing protein [Blastocatellia bacterium]|nr:pentapeptide repeat-containing protein [Blastocatellia bacterium]
MSQLSRGDIIDRITGGESLRGINLVRANLSAMSLARTDLAEANLRMADLTGADLREARLTGCFLSGAVLNEANLTGANLVEASLIGALMKGADLSGADLSGADLTGASLEGSQLAGAFLVGTFLNETELKNANLSGAYIRMAQMTGSNLSGAQLEGADLSNTDLSGVRLEGACLIGANFTGANLSSSSLMFADLRGADLSDANLSSCNLTGAKLRGIKFKGVKLEDAWAEWVDLAAAGNEHRASIEEAFTGIMGKPLAQILVEGSVSDSVWTIILAHLCEFQATSPSHADVRLKGIHQGASTSALYLEAARESSLAAYLRELAEIIGRGSDELFERLAAVAREQADQPEGSEDPFPPLPREISLAAQEEAEQTSRLNQVVDLTVAVRVEALQGTPFWNSDKAVAILTGNRRIWLEAASGSLLTLRSPHGAGLGLDLINGRFVTEESRRKQ